MSSKNGDIKSEWISALSPGASEDDFKFRLLSELSEFTKKPVNEIVKLGEDSQNALNNEWNVEYENDSTEYYRKNTTYLYNLIWWHSNYGQVNERVRILRYLKKNNILEILDFGSGIGSTAILFGMNGFKVSIADIAEPLMEFLDFRMKKRNLKYTSYNLNYDQLPANKFDAVTAIDVLEHVNDPKNTLQNIRDSLKPGGLICFNVCGSEGASMHVTEAEEVLCNMERLGFIKQKKHDVPLFIYKKTRKTYFLAFKGIYIFIYYHLRLRLRHILEVLGIYGIIKKGLKT